MEENKKDFFISYTNSDIGFAEWIAWQLEEAGYTVVIQAWDFPAGTNFVGNMQKALIEYERFLPVFSPAYFASLYCQAEWQAAFTQDPTGEKSHIVPVRIANCEPKGLLSPIIYIDLFNLIEEDAKNTLLQRISTDRIKPIKPPPFPGTVKQPSVKKPTFPGQLPINNLPYTRNPNFTGRQEIFDSIISTFNNSEYAALTQAISGLGGIGKTQIALEYAYRYGYTYSYILWVNAENQPELLESYLDIAMTTGIINKDETNKDIIQKMVLNWLNVNTNWLLIFDNAENPETIKAYLPKNNTGHILITSRYSDWHQISQPLPVEVFDLPEAVSFLNKITKIEDGKQAAELAEMLGRLPLALEQAAAYIINNSISYIEYIELYKKYGLELFNEVGVKPLDYQSTVSVTWNISIDKIDKESAKQLLNLCAFFAPENIDRSVFSDNSSCLPDPLSLEVQDKLSYNRIVAALSRYSLITCTDSKLSIHRLLQEVIKASLNKDVWLGYCINMMNTSFAYDYNHMESWSAFSQMVPHALSIAEQACNGQVNQNDIARIFNETGCWLYRSAMYNDAEALLKKAMIIREKVLGKDHPVDCAEKSGL